MSNKPIGDLSSILVSLGVILFLLIAGNIGQFLFNQVFRFGVALIHNKGLMMSKKLLSVAVKGKSSVWGFNFYADPKHLTTWRNDGLDIVEIENVIPEWIVDIGLVNQWCFMQDLFNLKNPFNKKDNKFQIVEAEKDE